MSSAHPHTGDNRDALRAERSYYLFACLTCRACYKHLPSMLQLARITFD